MCLVEKLEKSLCLISIERQKQILIFSLYYLFNTSQENITVCGKQGGKLEGNSSRKLLKSLDSLELELEKCSPEIYLKSLPFVKALRDFSLVVHLSFGQRLLPRWSQAISSFTLSYRALEKFNGKPVSVTPKVLTLYPLFFVHGCYCNSTTCNIFYSSCFIFSYHWLFNDYSGPHCHGACQGVFGDEGE